MPELIDPLPQLHNAPIQHDFRRLEDYTCWTQPLFKNVDYDQVETRTALHSSHRSIGLGTVNLTRSHYNGGIRLSSLMEDHVLFTFNSSGHVVFQADKRENAPPPGRGVLMVTPTEGQYIRGTGGGILMPTTLGALVQTAQAIQGPLAAQRLRERLQEPLQFFAYGHVTERSLPRSLLQSLHLVDSLLSPQGSVPAALRLDDLICRQLVLMICPELMADDDGALPAVANSGFEGLLEWMISRMAEPLSLSQLEAQSGYSRRALQRAFQNRFGCGPMQWLRRRRLDLALEQLTQANAGDSVSAIARRCGYLSLASFSRDFSSAYGRRPSEILRANQEPPAPDRPPDRRQPRKRKRGASKKRQKPAHIAKRIASARGKSEFGNGAIFSILMRHLIQFSCIAAASAAAVLGLDSGAAKAVIANISGIDYDVTTFVASFDDPAVSAKFATPANGGTMPWWGDQITAITWSNAVNTALGTPNTVNLFGTNRPSGPRFA